MTDQAPGNPGYGGDSPSRTYCTNPSHQPGQHSAACCPPAEPGNPELRLLRAIFGLCDRTDKHDHEREPGFMFASLCEDPDESWRDRFRHRIRLRHRWFIWINFRPHWWDRRR